MDANPIFEYWYFHLPNYIVSVLIYTLFGRFLLSFFVLPDSSNYIWRFFCRLTDPVMGPVRRITPGFVMELFLPLVAAFWLFVLRFGFYLVMLSNGWAPSLTKP